MDHAPFAVLARLLHTIRRQSGRSARERKTQRRGRDLIALVSRRLPQDFDNTDPASQWPLLGTALLSRMATTLETVLDLQSTRLEADAGTLTRSLYEHAVHFAWLAGDPLRINRWRQDDMDQRLRADNDMRAHGRPMLTPENRARFQKEVAAIIGGPIKLEQLAIVADKDWAGRLHGLSKHSDLNSFSGLYALLYRSYSPMAHPSERGLQCVAEEIEPGRTRVQMEQPSSRHGPWGVACVVFTAALLVASHSLGWPDATSVYSIYRRHE